MSLYHQSSIKISKGDQRGFTLIELMMTLAVAAVLIGAVVPAFQALIQRTQMAAEFNEVLGDLAYARSEAIKSNQAVSVCPTTDQSTCTGTDWGEDWLIFYDLNEDRDRDNADTILRIRQGGSDEFDIDFSNFAEEGGIRFDGDGKMEGGDAASVGEMVICDDRGVNDAQGLSFSVYGQFRLMLDTNDSGVVDYTDDNLDLVEVTCP